MVAPAVHVSPMSQLRRKREAWERKLKQAGVPLSYRDLILNAARWEFSTPATRSDANCDVGVVLALRRSGFSEEQIEAIYTDCPIGRLRVLDIPGPAVTVRDGQPT